jgi:Raf kinase inhibitor-like YbhB/YbcL family protein
LDKTYYFKGEIMKSWCCILSQLVLLSIIISANAEGVNTIMQITSPGFENQESVAKKFTCDGEDISPALEWSGVPEGTKSFALIVDDPDAPDPANPRMTWVHWVLYNIPATVSSLPEGVKDKYLPKGTLQCLNDWKKTGYGGPCPPIGKHRYFHKLYAVDIVLPDLTRPTKAKLEKAMEGHVLSKAELIGLYQRK